MGDTGTAGWWRRRHHLGTSPDSVLGTVPEHRHMRTMLWATFKSQVPIHGQRVGKQISSAVLILYANKLMNDWMASFFYKYTYHLSFSSVLVADKGRQKWGSVLQRASNASSLWWMAPWLEVLFPSWVVSLPQGHLLMPPLFRKRVTLLSKAFSSFTCRLFYFGGKRKPRGLLKDGMTVAEWPFCVLKCAVSLCCKGQPGRWRGLPTVQVTVLILTECLNGVSSSVRDGDLRTVEYVEDTLLEQWRGSTGSWWGWAACVHADPLAWGGTSLQQRQPRWVCPGGLQGRRPWEFRISVGKEASAAKNQRQEW